MAASDKNKFYQTYRPTILCQNIKIYKYYTYVAAVWVISQKLEYLSSPIHVYFYGFYSNSYFCRYFHFR